MFTQIDSSRQTAYQATISSEKIELLAPKPRHVGISRAVDNVLPFVLNGRGADRAYFARNCTTSDSGQASCLLAEPTGHSFGHGRRYAFLKYFLG